MRHQELEGWVTQILVEHLGREPDIQELTTEVADVMVACESSYDPHVYAALEAQCVLREAYETAARLQKHQREDRR